MNKETDNKILKELNRIQSLMKTSKLNESQTEVTEKGGFSKSATTMRGLNPKIKTIVILTAENPCGELALPETNNKRNSELEKILSQSFYGFRKVKGKYGSSENSFMVNNMTKETAIELGNKFRQDTIIYGERTENGMTFQMIKSYKCDNESEVGQVVGERKVFINRDKYDDFYSEIKGRKFQIPFFDVTDDSGNEIAYDKSEWNGGKIVGSYPIPQNISPEDDKEVDRLVAESLEEKKIPKWGWTRRGMIKNILKKYYYPD
jgi:hypothetical protein